MSIEQGDVEARTEQIYAEWAEVADEKGDVSAARGMARAFAHCEAALEAAEEDARFWKYEQTEASKELVARAEKAEREIHALTERMDAEIWTRVTAEARAEKAEQERDEAQTQQEILRKFLDASMTRAEKTERALGEQHRIADVSQGYIADLERALKMMGLSPAERIVVEAMREGIEYIHREDFDREVARAEKTERALAEIIDAKSYVNAGGYAVTADEAQELAIKRARAALLPSEDTSDES